jgi:alkane 1-monooxygenase
MTKIEIMKPKHYLFALLPAISVWYSFMANDYKSWTAVVFVFGFIPLLEWLVGPSNHNDSTSPEKENNMSDSAVNSPEKNSPLYEWILYLMVPIQWGTLLYFLYLMKDSNWDGVALGKVMAMGILCGSYGINVAHELGHRSNKFEQFLAKSLLLTSLYMHFFIEHNRGHHKHVGSHEDPSTARFNEPVQWFWVRSMVQTWFSAWNLEFERLKRAGKGKFHLSNQMLQFQLIQLFAVLLLGFFGGWSIMLFWVLAAFIGAVLLETINYIEHYGLMRKKLGNGYLELVDLHHSWNSNHPVGRLLLFELSRHSDHHYKTNKKYQHLVSHQVAPQMPTGYPGMMVLSLIFPLWFKIMNPKIEAWRNLHQ